MLSFHIFVYQLNIFYRQKSATLDASDDGGDGLRVVAGERFRIVLRLNLLSFLIIVTETDNRQLSRLSHNHQQ